MVQDTSAAPQPPPATPTHLIAMKAGRVAAQGSPGEVVTEEVVAEVFGMKAAVVSDPIAGTPMVVPDGTTR